MPDLSTQYVGLKLKNPLVPSASPLSRRVDNARRLEDAGAAAIVMYSLFEEELRAEEAMLERFLVHPEIGYAEASSFLPTRTDFQSGLDAYLEQLCALKEALEVPVIASLNGVTPGGWVELGKELQRAGADALELNVYYIVGDPAASAEAVEARYINLLGDLKRVVSLPIIMKLSPYFSSLPHFVKQIELAGAKGVALFNRFYQPDIDLETLTVLDQPRLSTSIEALLVMRWIAILHGRVNLTLAATSGVHTAGDALKMLLAGADVVHLASSLLQHGPQRLTDVLNGMETWMEEREYESVTQLKGSLSQRNQRDPSVFARASYVRILDSYTPPGSVWC